MKKIFMALSLCLMSVMCFGQLNVECEYDGSQTKSKVLTVMYQHVNYNKSEGFWISSATDNRFDKDGIFGLGFDKESALLTVNQLITLIQENERGYVVIVSDYRGGEHTLSLTKSLGVKSIWIKSKGCAGRYWIAESQLQKCIEFINEQ